MELAVIGKSEFTLGFRLTGIKIVIDLKTEEDVSSMLNNDKVGVVIIDEETFNGLSEQLKEDVISSIKPVFVVVSSTPQEGLRNMIIRSIGVDLLKN